MSWNQRSKLEVLQHLGYREIRGQGPQAVALELLGATENFFHGWSTGGCNEPVFKTWLHHLPTTAYGE